jgi:hypothetical protein
MALVSYVVWRRAKATSEGESQTGVEEGWEPTQGIPAEGASTGAGGGVSGAEEFMQHSQEASESRQQAAQEALEGRSIDHEEAVENRTVAREEAEEGRTFSLEEQRQRLAEWMAGKGRKAGVSTSKAKKPTTAHKEGKGGKGKRAHEKGNGNAGQKHHANHVNHQPGHHAKTDHRPAAPVRTRLAAPTPVAARPAAVKLAQKRRRR